MSNLRANRIDNVMGAVGELISALEAAGPVNEAQAKLLVGAAVRAVGKYQWWEIEQSVRRVLAATGQIMGAGRGDNQSR